jgi:DtxR family transcriptional regulator, Mn-dependent transcriptional regulator
MTKQVTPCFERYLEGIYLLQQKNGVARTGDLAKFFGVVSGTITNTVTKLKNEGLVHHQPYVGVTLTEEGKQIALISLKKHELLTKLFTNFLEIEQKLAYEVAFNIAGYFPENVIKKIEEKIK